MAQYISVEKENNIAIVTLNRPPLNVLSKQVFHELHLAFQELKDDFEVVAVLVTGAGDKAFAAGADIKEFPQLMGNPNMNKNVRNSHIALNFIDEFPKPTIAVLNGL